MKMDTNIHKNNHEKKKNQKQANLSSQGEESSGIVRRRSSTNKETDLIISHIVSRACEASVASDVSGLTDGDMFKPDDFQSPMSSPAKKMKNFRSVARAPEPPVVSPGAAKLTDIQSETTATTVSSSRDEKLSKKKKKRSVSFCEVHVRNYERILEINPSVTSGPAVGIGWNYSPDGDEIFSLENFEESREFSRRSSIEELAIPRDAREDLLRNLGYTQREIAWSVRTILRSKNQRKQTIQNLHASSMEELMEKATRKMKHVLMFPITRRKVKPQALPTNKAFESSAVRKPSLVVPSAA